MRRIDLSSADFKDKVYGCWLGKNSGGTLGAPLEKPFGEAALFDIWWYPKIVEGGLPNDDLELQLVWLKALEEVGPGLRARDLARYWLNHIAYNPDEYGFSKTNLRLGLEPPVSGFYNNWHRDGMGSPIRSELWACIAPGVPWLAARYAFEDAICDHAGGEGVYGEMFNAALESAAFVLSDRDRLLDIALGYIPPQCKTALAVRAARAAHAEGLDWKQARQRVIEAAPHHNAQYSPINMGFTVLGWLYGEDFGDAVCKAVNCGYDTDCTGATLGSYLGIISGRSGLPARWMDPLGDAIATSASIGGLTHTTEGPHPLPTTLAELTDRVIGAARRTLAHHGLLDSSGLLLVDPERLAAPPEIAALWSADPLRVEFAGINVSATVDYGESPTIQPEQAKTVRTHLVNANSAPTRVRCCLLLSEGWTSDPAEQWAKLEGHGSSVVNWDIRADGQAIQNANTLWLTLETPLRSQQPAVPIVLIGSNQYQRCAVRAEGRSDRESFDHPFGPETDLEAASIAWQTVFSSDNAIPLLGGGGEGCVYVRTFLHSLEDRTVRLVVSTTCPVKLWLNNELVIEHFHYDPLRPSYAGHYGYIEDALTKQPLTRGWNHVLMKFVTGFQPGVDQAYFLLCEAESFHDGIVDIGRTQVPNT